MGNEEIDRENNNVEPLVSNTGAVSRVNSGVQNAVHALGQNSEAREVNPNWNPTEEGSFKPWREGGDWEHIGSTQVEKGSDFSIDGKCFHITETPGTHQLLEVRWPNKTGRAEYGYVVRTNYGEVVAVIHQGAAWSWLFKLKYEPEELKGKHCEEGGWIYQNLFKNCLNIVMYYLEKKTDE